MTNDLPLPVTHSNLHCRSDYREVEYEVMMDLYPVTLVKDRYHGTYSGGKWIAFNRVPWDIPEAVLGSDVPCATYFNQADGQFAVGSTMEEALKNLYQIVKENAALIQHVGYDPEIMGYGK